MIKFQRKSYTWQCLYFQYSNNKADGSFEVIPRSHHGVNFKCIRDDYSLSPMQAKLCVCVIVVFLSILASEKMDIIILSEKAQQPNRHTYIPPFLLEAHSRAMELVVWGSQPSGLGAPSGTLDHSTHERTNFC